ncbi:MAG: type I-F CRISPR-associated protein Csy3 [Sulfurovum sp.]|nr:type I-F CRISPR-associated protein Csy3 [Sulfurovum sp.]
MATQIKNPSVLSFDRKLEPSDALMYSGKWNNIGNQAKWEEIKLIERRNRGVKSNFKSEVLEDEEELRKQIEEPNPVWGDDAALQHDHDTLRVSFSLRVVGGLDRPSACNEPSYQERLSEMVAEYGSNLTFQTLAYRYATNIANGRFLWRNRIGVEDIKVFVTFDTETLKFEAYDYSLNDFNATDDKISKLAETIAAGLSGESSTFLKIDAYAKMGEGQRIWPSQEMRMNIPKGEKSRYLFHLNGCAATHSQKIGNALRTIDNWYGDDVVPIAVEPYGSVTHQGRALRAEKNKSFSTLIRKWIDSKELTDNEKHFVMAILIRGGVFSEKEAEE